MSERTFEELYLTLENDDVLALAAYHAKRQAKVESLIDWLESDEALLPGVRVAQLAEQLMCSAEERGRFDGDGISGEVAGSLRVGRTPLTFTI